LTFVHLDKTAREPPAHASRRCYRTISDPDHAHSAALDGTVFDEAAGGAPKPTRSLRVRDDSSLQDSNRVMQLVNLDAVVSAHSRIADMDDREPAVADRRPRSTSQPEHQLIHESSILGAGIITGYYSSRGRYDRPRFRLAETVGDLRDGPL